jgi:beta-lactamase superfamily II metal-dependent hydrolase
VRGKASFRIVVPAAAPERSIDGMADRYVGSFAVGLVDDDGERVATLLWGDPVHVLSTSGGKAKVLARGRPGWVDSSDLTDQSLLELYVIDVGQGDGVLIKTPRDRWILVDGGRSLADQMTKKGTANFLRWKFVKDLREDAVKLESIVVTHPDQDHFGGVADVLLGRLWEGTTFPVEVGTLYHSGFGRFAARPQLGATERGEVAPFPVGFRGVQRSGSFHTELLEDADDFANPPRPFWGSFAEYASLVASVPRTVQRLSHLTGYLPGYGPTAQLTIRVLGPILEEFAPGKRGLRRLESDDGITLNGHSVVLRLEYGDVRLLLAGDLNTRSQRLLRSYLPDAELQVDVAKACHHGAEDVDPEFLQATGPRVTVISSGDNESYSHPRPVLIGSSAWFGREAVDPTGKRMPPLVYSTELARSVRLAFARDVRQEATDTFAPPERFQVKVDERTDRYEPLERLPVASDLVYGLVNVRTDGRDVLCATMEEQGNAFDVKVIRVGA